ncbi:hypothetical protein VTK26DRAFT_8384 [Humicola hyalothermophila]
MQKPSQRWWSGLGPLLLLGPVAATAAAAATAGTATAAATATTAAAAAAPFDCEKVVEADGGHTYNLRGLAGPHTVVTHEYARPTFHNTTYTLDLCAPLRQKGEVPPEEACPDGTRVCAIKHRWDPKTDKTETDQVIPIVVAGDDKDGPFAWEAKRLPADRDGGDDDDDDDDAKNKDGAKKKEGLRLTLAGTTYQRRAQRTVVEFRCNPDLTGDEGEWESLDKYVPAEEKKNNKNSRREEEEKKKEEEKEEAPPEESTPERQLKKDGAALVWEGYKREKDQDGKDMDTLYLTWYTKFVCSDAVDQPEPVQESSHWGFFTWFVILLFLAIAAYLIFGSWLNYNRYGARGWDLLPHGDTLRDVPYLLKDWIRRLLNTVQSSGSRGGYSAV